MLLQIYLSASKTTIVGVSGFPVYTEI